MRICAVSSFTDASRNKILTFISEYKTDLIVVPGNSRNHPNYKQVLNSLKNGAVELGWSFPLRHYPNRKSYVQYFSGYGESLIDYDQYVNRLRIGIALTDWL